PHHAGESRVDKAIHDRGAHHPGAFLARGRFPTEAAHIAWGLRVPPPGRWPVVAIGGAAAPYVGPAPPTGTAVVEPATGTQLVPASGRVEPAVRVAGDVRHRVAAPEEHVVVAGIAATAPGRSAAATGAAAAVPAAGPTGAGARGGLGLRGRWRVAAD